MIFHRNSYTVKFKVSVVEWKCHNKASIYGPAKEFADDGVREWCQCYSTLKAAECLENAAVYGVANLCQSILTIEFLEDKRSEGRSVSNQLLKRLCQHLGVAPEEGVYMRDTMVQIFLEGNPSG